MRIDRQITFRGRRQPGGETRQAVVADSRKPLLQRLDARLVAERLGERLAHRAVID
jgi:hypothetical protein